MRSLERWGVSPDAGPLSENVQNAWESCGRKKVAANAVIQIENDSRDKNKKERSPISTVKYDPSNQETPPAVVGGPNV